MDRIRCTWYMCACGNGYYYGYGFGETGECENCAPEIWQNREVYSKEVYRISAQYWPIIPGVSKKLKGWDIVVDHIVPISYGWREQIPVHRMASMDNLQVVCTHDNHKKHSAGPEEWREHITEANWRYWVVGGNNVLYNYLDLLARDYALDYISVAGAMIRNPTEFSVGKTLIRSGKKIQRADKSFEVVWISETGEEKAIKGNDLSETEDLGRIKRYKAKKA